MILKRQFNPLKVLTYVWREQLYVLLVVMNQLLNRVLRHSISLLYLVGEYHSD
ncbi:MAG: hypothetical protein SFU91_04030 [Chloroherpetonaceae bacterium]|nr:hypothetical protein [Chloroherpetonaceae bacterium]